MLAQRIEDVIDTVLIGDAKHNALAFSQFLAANEMVFEREKGYWEDKYYWGIKHHNAYVCFMLISNEEKTDSESWTVWSDDSGANTYADAWLDETSKELLWRHVVVCENVERCFEGCKRSRKTLFGKAFDNVCGTAFKFENPDLKTVECMKKMIDVRKDDIRTSMQPR